MDTAESKRLSQPRPTEVVYCTRCVVSNQRPRIEFDRDGVCNACQHAWRKDHEIDWDARDQELREVLDRHRSKSGEYDVVVPGSGGKDSAYVAHVLKHEYGMHPLTVTWAPHIYTDIGWKNFQNFIDSGFDNIMGWANGQVHRKLTRLSLVRMGDPFQPFIFGQMAFPLRIAVKYGVPLVFYGEDGEVEYGGSSKNEERSSLDLDSDIASILFSGLEPEAFVEDGIDPAHLQPYILPSLDEMRAAGIDYHHFSYFKKWVPQEHYYYAVEHTNFQANPIRSDGTYSKYASLDDKLDGLHYYFAFIKFGIGRATSDASHEIRDGHLTREEGVSLVRKYDGEFPSRHFAECLEYLDMTEEEFSQVVDGFRPDHIWKQENGEWRLRHQVT